MAKKVATKILDSQIKSTVNLDRYSEHVRRKVIKLLNETQKNILSEIASQDPTAVEPTKWREKRLTNLNKSIGEIFNKQYKTIKKQVNSDLRKISLLTGKETVANLNAAIGAEIANVTLTQEGLKSIVNNTMIDGQVIGKWWDELGEKARRTTYKHMVDATRAVQLGLVRGEAVGELIRRIRGTKLTPGVISMSKREATTLVRTSVMQVANEVRMEMYEGNKDLINGYEVVGTLDKRTCVRCRSFDGKQWIEDGKPIKGITDKDVTDFKMEADLGAVGDARTKRLINVCYV